MIYTSSPQNLHFSRGRCWSLAYWTQLTFILKDRQEVESERYEHYPSIEINREWWCKINIFACTCNYTLIEEFTLYPKRILGKILPFVLIIFTALLLGVIRCRYQFYIPIMYEIKLKIHVCPRGMGFYRHCMNFKNLCLR